MDMIELRLLFVAGLVLLGGLLALAGALLAAVIERLRSHRGLPAATMAQPSRPDAARAGALGHAGERREGRRAA